MSNLEYKYIWVDKKFVKILNENGYVHFITKKKAEDFTKGRAFYYCIENKEYGYVECVPNIEIQNIKTNEDYLIGMQK